MQLAFLTFLPSIYLSGLLCPDRGHAARRPVTGRGDSLTYYLKVVRGIVLKGVGLEHL